MRCDGFCKDLVDANCSDGPTMDGCLLTCKALTSSSACDTKANTYFDCIDGGTVTCNMAGDPTVTGCGLSYLDAIGCAVSENPNPSIVQPCQTYCGNVAAEMCPNNGTEMECNTNCLWAGATGTGCDDEWQTFLTCANGANWSCVLGFAVAAGCGQQFTAYSQCIDSAGN